MKKDEQFELPPNMGGIFEQPFILLDNSLLLRKDFVVGVKKMNDYENQVYSIIVYYESIEKSLPMEEDEEESDQKDNHGHYLSFSYDNGITEFPCFLCPTPEERDVRFEEIKLQLNVS